MTTSRADALRAGIIEIGKKGFERGYSAACDQLAEPITAAWLAEASGLPEARCGELLAGLRAALVKAAQVDAEPVVGRWIPGRGLVTADGDHQQSGGRRG